MRNQVLDYKVKLDLEELINKIKNSLQLPIQASKATIYTHLKIKKINTVKSYIYSIIYNLISNAIKFSGRDSKIYVTLKRNESKIRFEVKDEGPGISKEDKPKLFQKFQKLEARPTDGENSTGLGLSIVKKYVEAMGGLVWCESEQGHGSTFTVEFHN